MVVVVLVVALLLLSLVGFLAYAFSSFNLPI